MFVLLYNTDTHQTVIPASVPNQSMQPFHDPAIMASIPYGSPGLAHHQSSLMMGEGSVSRMSFGRPSGLVQGDSPQSTPSSILAQHAAPLISSSASILSQVSSMGETPSAIVEPRSKHSRLTIICAFSSQYQAMLSQQEDIIVPADAVCDFYFSSAH